MKPTLSTGSPENEPNVTTPYVIRECPTETPSAGSQTGITSVSLSNSAVSVSPNRSLMSSVSTTLPVLSLRRLATMMSVADRRELNAT